jgi:hypothetical protein
MRDQERRQQMFRTTALAAAAIATTIAAQPVSTANAMDPNFYFGFQTPGGYFAFGNGPGPVFPQPQPQAMTCWDAKSYLQTQFNQVWTVECQGQTYTFNVKNLGPVKTVKINKYNGNYWYV